MSNVIWRLENDSLIAIEWFEWNYMKLNEDKCHLIVAGNKHQHMWANVGSAKIRESHREKLLGIHIDRDLKFNYHISNLCVKAGRKLSALIRLYRYYNLDQRRNLMKTFIESQFSYSPMAWMFHDRRINNQINKLHERALRIVYRDDTATFEELLKRDNSLRIHHRNIKKMAVEMYKCLHQVGPSLLGDIFEKRKCGENSRILRSNNDFLLPQVNTVHYGHDSLRYLGCKIWELIPSEIKTSTDIETFKIKIKSWVPSSCPCRLCR